jgi:predicted transcriptional regulator
MKKTTKLRITADGVKGFFDRARAHAPALDRGEELAPEITVSFESVSDMLRVLSAERVGLLRVTRERATSMSALAIDLRRARNRTRRKFARTIWVAAVPLREKPRAWETENHRTSGNYIPPDRNDLNPLHLERLLVAGASSYLHAHRARNSRNFCPESRHANLPLLSQFQ